LVILLLGISYLISFIGRTFECKKFF